MAVLLEAPVQSLPDVRSVGKIEARRHHADDEMVRPVEADRSADDRAIGVVAATPEAIADHGLEVAVDAEARVAGEGRPDLRRDAEHVEKVATRLDCRYADGVVDTIGDDDLWHP